jgi:hypothetical protein
MRSLTSHEVVVHAAAPRPRDAICYARSLAPKADVLPYGHASANTRSRELRLNVIRRRGQSRFFS